MKKVFICFIFSFYLLNCNKKEEKIITKSKPYIISYEDQKLQTYHVRKTTQEEDTILKYKKNGEYYDFENIKWDETKIKLPKYKISKL